MLILEDKRLYLTQKCIAAHINEASKLNNIHPLDQDLGLKINSKDISVWKGKSAQAGKTYNLDHKNSLDNVYQVVKITAIKILLTQFVHACFKLYTNKKGYYILSNFK